MASRPMLKPGASGLTGGVRVVRGAESGERLARVARDQRHTGRSLRAENPSNGTSRRPSP